MSLSATQRHTPLEPMPYPRPASRRALSLVVLATVAWPLAGFAQRAEPMTAALVRALTKEAEAEAKGDGNALVIGLDKRIRARWGDFESFPLSVTKREDISVTLTMPYMRYRLTLADHLRFGQPIANIEWTDAVVVSVGPERIEAPDITSIVVQRDGSSVAPVKNALTPMHFTNGTGESATLHAGEVHFPLSAFAASAVVTVSAIPQTGPPFVLTLGSEQLLSLK